MQIVFLLHMSNFQISPCTVNKNLYTTVYKYISVAQVHELLSLRFVLSSTLLYYCNATFFPALSSIICSPVHQIPLTTIFP